MKAQKDFGVEVKELEGTTADEWEANLLAVCEDGYDLVICSSSNFEEYMTAHGGATAPIEDHTDET